MDGTLTILTNLTTAFWLNCKIFLLTLIFALPLGLIISAGSVSKRKAVSVITRAFVGIITSIPLLIMMFIIYYAPGFITIHALWGAGTQGRFVAATVAFVISYSCLFSEIFRDGIQAVLAKQTASRQVFGMPISRVFSKNTFFHVIRSKATPMFRMMIALVRDTVLLRFIAISEILMRTNEYLSRGLIWPLFSTALYFVILVGVLRLLFYWLKKKLDTVNV